MNNPKVEKISSIQSATNLLVVQNLDQAAQNPACLRSTGFNPNSGGSKQFYKAGQKSSKLHNSTLLEQQQMDGANRCRTVLGTVLARILQWEFRSWPELILAHLNTCTCKNGINIRPARLAPTCNSLFITLLARLI